MKKRFGWMLLCAILALCMTMTSALATDATLHKRPDDDSDYRSTLSDSATTLRMKSRRGPMMAAGSASRRDEPACGFCFDVACLRAMAPTLASLTQRIP